MRPLVLNHAVAAAIFFPVYAAWVVWELVLQRRTGTPDRTRMSEVIATTAGSVLIFPASAVGLRLPGPKWLPVVVGVALLVAGWAFRAWAVRTLGRWFKVTVTVEPGQQVVDFGPYRLIRHPSYTGILVALLGSGIALDSWASVAVAVVLPLLAILRRIGEEEAILLRELGTPYTDYMRRTWRLVPGVW